MECDESKQIVVVPYSAAIAIAKVHHFLDEILLWACYRSSNSNLNVPKDLKFQYKNLFAVL